MQKTGKPCYLCGSFQRYYTKGMRNFNPLKIGRCCKKDETVSACGGCDKWKGKNGSGTVPWGVKKALNNIMIDLSAIRQVIEETENEKLQ